MRGLVPVCDTYCSRFPLIAVRVLFFVQYPSLGNFVNRQRTEYRKLLQGRSSSMTQNKIADLNRVGFLWSVREGGHCSWDTRLMELRDYQLKNGHCNVPVSLDASKVDHCDGID